MSQKRKSRARSRFSDDDLTPRQAAFIREYADQESEGFGNAARACASAGYRGDRRTLAVQGHRNLQHPGIKQAIASALHKQGFTPDFAASLLMDAMRATVVQVVPNRKGKSIARKFPHHAIRLQGFDRASRLLETPGNEARSDSELPSNDEAASEFALQDRGQIRSASEKVKAILRLIAQDESLPSEMREVVLRLISNGPTTANDTSENNS